MTTITENLSKVHEDINRACRYAMVEEATPNIIAVSKRQSLDKITEALDAGHRVFGENRLQEAQSRWPGLKQHYDGVSLHLIGQLQTNKVSDAVALFDVIQSIDREKLARSLAGEMVKQNKRPDIFIQVNTGSEPQKGGVLPEDLPALVALCRDELTLPLVGLMCIPPSDQDPSLHFALLAKLAKRYSLPRLSMGMSGDFGLAASMGATDVRIGTAIFGARND